MSETTLELRCSLSGLKLAGRITRRIDGDISERVHDALAAHCLMQAIDELGNVTNYCAGDVELKQHLLERAAQLLAEVTK